MLDGLPLAAYQDLSSFKLYYSDMGIMSARLGMTLGIFLGQESERFRGIFAENYLACDQLIPVECKAGDHVKARSLMQYMDRFHPAYATRVSGRNFGMVNKIRSVPLYAVFCL